MNRPLVSILFFLVIGTFGIVNSYKWVPLKSGSPLPNNTVRIVNLDDSYVGRAKHLDDILPAEVSENGEARISACGEEILKDEYEILTSSDDCEWVSEREIQHQENILQVGTNNWNNEPIYIGVSGDEYYRENHITLIYGNIRRGDKRLWIGSKKPTGYYYDWFILCCNIKTEWVATTATQLPNNKVYSGISKDDYETYVARLKKDCDKVIGQVSPHMGIAKANLPNGKTMQAFHVDVLISEPKQYAWIKGSKGTIPEYPIVEANAYVAIVDKTVVSLTRNDALELLNYEILARNYSQE